MRFRLLAALFLASAVVAEAQEYAAIRDFDFVKETTPCLGFSNAAWLSGWSGKLSKVSLAFDKQDGEVRSLEASPDSYTLSAGTESFCRISERLAFHGFLSWSRFSGKKMGGPILLYPDYNPVNFLESDPTTIGVKNRELYSMTGALSYDLGKRWSAGISANYVAGDQSKVKDPRFYNIWMDLGLEAGVAFRPSAKLMLGASAIFRNTLEQLKGGIFGTTDKQYFIYTDRGGFFGTTSELAGDYNHISVSSSRPMDNTYLGLSLQLVAAERFSNEFRFLSRNGYYGRKSSSTAIFFEYSGIELRYDGSALFPVGSDLHRLQLSVGFETLSNEENVFSYVTPIGENTKVVYTGQNHILDRSLLNASLSYRWYREVRDGRPRMTLGADFDAFSKTQTTTVYPFYRNHSYARLDADLFGAFDFGKRSHIFSIEAHAIFGAGNGIDKEDGSYATSSSSSLKSFDAYLGRQFEYETAARAGGGLAFTWRPALSAKFSPYIRLADTLLSLLSEPQYLEGRNRNIATITIGCYF